MAFRRVLVLIALALAAAVQAEVEKWTYTFGGRPVGTGTFEMSASGEFSGDMTAQVATTKIRSKITGKLKGGKLAECDMDAASGPNAAIIRFANGKWTVNQGGKDLVKDEAHELGSDIYLSTFHPSLAMGVSKQLKDVTSAAKLKVFLFDSFAAIEVKFARREVSAEIDGAIKQIEVLRFSMGGLDMDYAFDAGMPVGINVPAQTFGVYREGYSGVFLDPVLKYKELSQPLLKSTFEEKVMCPMGDGVALATSITRPATPGRYPVVLVRTPYGRANDQIKGDWWASRGYVLVSQDVRGRGESEGAWDPFNHEVVDGKATLDWLVGQPWCDGNVGMIGASYLGSVQWSAAVTQHPALKCIVPQVSPPDPTLNIPWDHGAFMLAGAIWWTRVVKEKDADLTNMLATIDNGKAFLEMPLTRVDDKFFGKDIAFFNDWLRRPTLADWKGAFRTDQLAKVTIPVLHISGIWDGDGIGTKVNWQAVRAAKGNQWLIFGPWDHFFNSKSKFADQEYGDSAVLELDSVYLRFFDTYLKGKSVAWNQQPKAKVFVTGANQWYTGSDWPFPYAKKTTFYLGGGSAKGSKSMGSLVSKVVGIAKDEIAYDPTKPGYTGKDIEPGKSATTIMAPNQIGKDELLFKSEPFDHDTVVTGPIQADLYVSTTARDATFHAYVVEVRRDGSMQVIGMPGTKRVWFDVLGKPGPITPNKVYKISIEPWETAHRIAKGNRLGLIVTSDMFPQFARNPGTGEPDWRATKFVRAKHSIYRTAKYPSSLSVYSFQP